jgi:RNA polymerase sigma-70 factor (ECF subfamily)
VRSVLRDEEQTEAVMQHAYVAAYFALEQYRGEAAFSTWLARIAYHEAPARRREGKRFETADDVDLPAHGRSPEERAADREIAGILQRAIDRLPPALSAVFVLREVEGMATAEVAHVLDLTEANVKVRLHRARRRLRSDLASRLGAGVASTYLLHASADYS